jgi:DNA-binding transcriptional LysR family regulator
MDATDLKVFEAVARLGSMSRAATELNTVQSNVTAHIRLLEEELGTPLFSRHSRGVVLTDAGRRLLPYASRIGHLFGEARRAVDDDGEPSGALTIGSLETTAAMRLPPILSAYAAAHPQVDLVLRTGTTCELVEGVLQHQLEAAFVCGPVNHPDLEEEVIFREELVLVTAPSVKSLTDVFLTKELKIIVLRIGCSYRQRLEEILARRGVVGLRHLEFGSVDAILGCVIAGLGVTLLPKRVVSLARREGQIIIHELPPEESLVDTVVIRRHDAYVSSALNAFLECTRPAPARMKAAE